VAISEVRRCSWLNTVPSATQGETMPAGLAGLAVDLTVPAVAGQSS
jgi:hypothetical protein